MSDITGRAIRSPKSIIEELTRRTETLPTFYTTLTTMGFSSSYVAHLKSQGMDAMPELQGLVNATADEVTKINNLWGQI